MNIKSLVNPNSWKNMIRRSLWYICRLIPVSKNKVVAMSYTGRGYCDNPKYIVEELLRQDLPCQIYWVVKNPSIDNHLPSGIRPIKLESLQYVYHMTTARLWIDNCRKFFYGKRPGQFYIQTWHGGHGLKKIEGACLDALEPEYINCAKHDSEMSDLFLSNSGLLTDLYLRDFWYSGPVMEEGLPRNDIFFQEDFDRDSVRRALKIPQGKKVMLYAPTFRSDHSLEPYQLDCKKCALALKDRFGGDWVILYRLHPNIFELSDQLHYDPEYAINASDYFDIQELYTIADAVMTDYSSVVLDFMITGKPSFLFATDIDKYREDRGFALSLDELPSPLATGNDQLADLIRGFDAEKFKREADAFMARTRVHETGHASRSAVEWIREHVHA